MQTVSVPQVGFVLEYLSGHATHAENLKSALMDDPTIRPIYVDISPDATLPKLGKLPGFRSSWSLRSSLGAYLAVRPQINSLDALMFHTQVTSLFSTGLMRHVPTVISLDATPLQFDAIGSYYGHTPNAHTRVGAIKHRMNLKAFGAARHLIAWSQWVKTSLVSDYGIAPEKISVIPPGIDTSLWKFQRSLKHKGEQINLLFVGYDFWRKGGEALLEAIQILPNSVQVHLHVVTKSQDIRTSLPNVSFYNNVLPNSETLMNLFRQADVFVFPTRSDGMPLALMEALAAGLPIITTSVAALPEIVTDAETGFVIPPDDRIALADMIVRLASDGILRRNLGEAARDRAEEHFNAAKNYAALAQTVKQAIH